MSWNGQVRRVGLPRSLEDYSGRITWRHWALSVVFHAALVVVLGLAWPLVPKGQPGSQELVFPGQVALKHLDDQGEVFYQTESQDSAQTNTASQESVLDQLLNDQVVPEPKSGLPNLDILGPGDSSPSAGGGAEALLGGETPGRSLPGTQRSKTTFFGVEGEGTSFVYVLDRSASMGSAGGVPLRAAKAQLKASLGALKPTNLFYIIFYNDRPRMFRPPGTKHALVFANARNKLLAMQFIDSITAQGATQHREALLKALSFQPDVIFFLTDGDDPPLREPDLAEIRRRAAGGTTIHVIQFGQGPLLKRESFLTQLARENRGTFHYVDIYELIRQQGASATAGPLEKEAAP